MTEKNKPLTVTLISTLPPWIGISKYTEPLVRELAKQAHVQFIGFKSLYPKFLYPGDPKDKNAVAPNIKNVDLNRIITWYNPLSWIYAGFNVKGSVIHAQWWSYVLAPIYLTVLSIAKYIKRKRIVLTVHNVEPHEKGWLKNKLNSSIYFLADHFIVHTKQSKKKMVDKFNVSEEMISVIPHGVLLPAGGLQNITQDTARQKLDIDRNKKVLLFFGIIRDYKGLDILLKSVARLVKQHENLLLLIAGKPWEDWEKYQKIIDENNLENHIKADLGFIEEDMLEYYFKASDLVVLPYKHFDAQSGVGPLALPFEVPLVVTKTGGLPELVKNEDAIAKANNVKDLAKKMNIILENSTLMDRMKGDAKDMLKNYSWDKITESTMKIYEKDADGK